MLIAKTEVTNSVNEEEMTNIKICASQEEAEAFVEVVHQEVEEWNKPEDGPGGRMSYRYLHSEINEVTRDTDIEGLKAGDLADVLEYVRTLEPTVAE